MNCSETTTTRGGRYPEYTSSSEGWCATTEDYYNENYLPNDSHLATVSGGVPPQGAQYNSYYEYHHPPPPHQNMNPSSTGASSPPLNHQHHPAPPLSHQVSSFPQKRSPSEQDISYNNNYEPKSPSGGTSPWNNFHSFYTKNPASPTSNSIGESPASPQPSGGGNVLSGNDNSNNCGTVILGPQKFGRPSVKRRTTANKKERRRTQSINNAFADLRDCIPNVPADTKLSKIKTLRLATSYIAYLSEVLSGDDPLRTPQAFTAEISKKMGRGDEKRRKELLMQELAGAGMKRHEDSRKSKGRTGWPQHVWALELQN